MESPVYVSQHRENMANSQLCGSLNSNLRQRFDYACSSALQRLNGSRTTAHAGVHDSVPSHS